MEKYKRHIDIDFSKFSPDIIQDKRETKFGLPNNVQFCNECVMSNQKPNSCYEFQHHAKSIKKSMHIANDGVCDACKPATTKTILSTGKKETTSLEHYAIHTEKMSE